MTTSQTTQPLLARAWADGYLPSPERFDEIVTKACEHRPWFNDYVWDNELLKRTIVIKYLADTYTNGRVWEVWRNEEICGILLVERVNMGVDAYFHAIFFDRQLAGKRNIALSAMEWAFQAFGLEVLRSEIPAFMHILAKWMQRKVGFRPETPDGQGSAVKRRAYLWKGTWHDALLLSVTKDEFASLKA
jgi:hypothetical protein